MSIRKTVSSLQRCRKWLKATSKKDIKEYFHYYPWGQCPDTLKAELQRYYEEANKLASQLLGWVEEHSPANVSELYSQPLSSMIDGSEKTLLRVLALPATER